MEPNEDGIPHRTRQNSPANPLTGGARFSCGYRTRLSPGWTARLPRVIF